MDKNYVIELLKEQASAASLAGMQRFGIDSSKALGVPIPQVRKLAKLIKKNHGLALELWGTEIHEARILASMIADPDQVTKALMDAWVKDFYSWDLCDQVCGNLFDRTPFAVEKALEYSKAEMEFTKRAGFVLMAEFAVHNKKAGDELFFQFFAIMEREAWDDRNFVKKAVNWALRQIGKRSPVLHKMAMETAEKIALQGTKSARWIASNALAELRNKFQK